MRQSSRFSPRATLISCIFFVVVVFFVQSRRNTATHSCSRDRSKYTLSPEYSRKFRKTHLTKHFILPAARGHPHTRTSLRPRAQHIRSGDPNCESKTTTAKQEKENETSKDRGRRSACRNPTKSASQNILAKPLLFVLEIRPRH